MPSEPAIPTSLVDSIVENMVNKAKLDRTESRMVAETAAHAANEAMETIARICMALDNPAHVLAALTIAATMVRAVSETASSEIRDFAGEVVAAKKRAGQ